MLELINTLRPFFEDCYRQFSVREFAKLIKVSPPTASRLLKNFNSVGILHMREDRGFLLFSVNIDSRDFIDFSRIYWRKKLQELVAEFERVHTAPVIVLFGSLSKAEVKPDSDIDLAVFSPQKRDIDLNSFKKQFKREVNVHWFKSLAEVKSVDLLNNILNGCVLSGGLRL